MTRKQDTADDDARKWLELVPVADQWLAKNAPDRREALTQEVRDAGIARYLNEGKNKLGAYLKRALVDALRKGWSSSRRDTTEDADAKGALSVDGSSEIEATAEINRLRERRTVEVTLSMK